VSKATSRGLDYQGSITFKGKNFSSPQERRAAGLPSAPWSITH